MAFTSFTARNWIDEYFRFQMDHLFYYKSLQSFLLYSTSCLVLFFSNRKEQKTRTFRLVVADDIEAMRLRLALNLFHNILARLDQKCCEIQPPIVWPIHIATRHPQRAVMSSGDGWWRWKGHRHSTPSTGSTADGRCSLITSQSAWLTAEGSEVSASWTTTTKLGADRAIAT